MSATDDHGRPKIQTGNGALLAIPYDGDKTVNDLQDELSSKAESPGEAKTPDPTDEGDTQSRARGSQRSGGPIRRINDIVDRLGSVGLEKLGLDGGETAKAIAKRTDEIYRNEFPIVTPRFQARCDHCGTEFDEDPGDGDAPDDTHPGCPECGADALHTIDESERAQLERITRSVNKEGQSFRELAKFCEGDHSRLGVAAMAVKWRYTVAREDIDLLGQRVADRGSVVTREFDELVRADTKRVVPVVDDNGRIGNHWWACPIHRPGTTDDDAERDISKSPGRCRYCNAELREVWYVELEGVSSRRSTTTDIAKYYFRDEMVMWAHHIPRLNGLDGVSPIHLIWLQQAVLHWMDRYAAEYFNPNSGQTPNKFVIIHTTNVDRLEKQLDEAERDREESPYNDGLLYNEVGPGGGESNDAQVIDMMGDEFLGQSEWMRSNYEGQIRSVFGLTDVHDSDTEGAGGLNNEGLQLEVTDRSIAAAQQELADGPFRTLLDILGFSDWRFRFVPHRETDLEERKSQLDILHKAAELGLPARMEDGEAVVGDGEADASDAPSAFGAGAGGSGPGSGAGGAPPGQQQPGAGPSPPRTPTAPNQSARHSESESEICQKAVVDEPLDPAPDADVHLHHLENAFKHIVWPDPDAESLDELSQKSTRPYWGAATDVPQYVTDAIRKAIHSGVVWNGIDGIDGTALDVGRFFKHQLDDPDGWSLASLSESFSHTFDAPISKAINVVRSETAAIINKAREIGYRSNPDLGDSKFYWQGPEDSSTTIACTEVKAKTNPAYGGEPVTLDELREITRAASDKYFPRLDYREWLIHPAERHTFFEVA